MLRTATERRPCRRVLPRLAILLAWVALPLGAGETHDHAARRSRALALMDAALRADQDAIARAGADLNAILRENPDDAVALVHRGWLRVLQARTAPLVDARTMVEEGCAEMDTAVALSPENMTVRFVRARSDSQLPRLLEREPSAAADFAILVTAARGGPERPRLPPALRRAIFFHAGAFALKQRQAAEAVTLLEEASRIAAESPSDHDVQSMLALARRESTSSPEHGEDPQSEKG